MKIDDVFEEANKKILNINLFLNSFLGTILMNIILFIIIEMMLMIAYLSRNITDNIILESIGIFLLFLIVGIVYIALSYGIITHIYRLSNNEKAKVTDIFKNAAKKLGMVIRVFLRVICKFILQIVLLVISGVTMILSLVMLLVLVMANFFGSISEYFSTLFGASNINSFRDFIIGTNLGEKELLLIFIMAFFVFVITSVFIFIKRMSYSLTDFLIYENSEDNSRYIVEKSEELMIGKKLTYFGIIIFPVIISIISSAVFEFSQISHTLPIILHFCVSTAITTYAYILQVAFYRIIKKEENNV